MTALQLPAQICFVLMSDICQACTVRCTGAVHMPRTACMQLAHGFCQSTWDIVSITLCGLALASLSPLRRLSL